MTCQLIGAGRAGTVVALALSNAGYTYTWIGSNRLENAGALAGRLGITGYGVRYRGFPGKAGFLILAVPDDEIARSAREAVEAGVIVTETVAAHLSGARGSDALDSARKAGASVMAFHPAQSFTPKSDHATVFRGICFDMEGDDRACTIGERVARNLGAVSVRLDPATRVFTHLAMTIASNYTVSLVRMAEDIMRFAGVDDETARRMLIPLFSNTISNIADAGTLEALTGPVSRGDSVIIRRHLDALGKIGKDYEVLYRGLALIALDTAVARGELPRGKAQEIEKLLE